MPSHDDHGDHWPALAQAVRDRRRELGIPTQKAAAHLAHISQNTWQRLEAGTPVSMTKLTAAAEILRWDPAYPVAILEQGTDAAATKSATAAAASTMTSSDEEPATTTDSGKVTIVPSAITLEDVPGLGDTSWLRGHLVLVPVLLPPDVFNDLDEEDVQWLISSVTRQGRELAATISEARRRARYKEQRSCGDL